MTNTNNLDRIKAIIRLHGPQTVGDLMKATGLKYHQVKNGLDQALSRTGGIVRAGRAKTNGGAQLYGLPGIHAPKAKEYPKPYVAPFKEMKPHDYDIYAGRNLALLAR